MIKRKNKICKRELPFSGLEWLPVKIMFGFSAIMGFFIYLSTLSPYKPPKEVKPQRKNWEELADFIFTQDAKEHGTQVHKGYRIDFITIDS